MSSRRKFITLLCGAAAAWPLPARAQQSDRMRRIGVLLGLAASDDEGQVRLATFLQALQELGWTDGRNVQIDRRFTDGDPERARAYAAELVALVPDLLLTSGASTTGAILPATRIVPVVFVGAADPVGAGFVDSLARPGGNVTGFMSYEFSMAGKWLELLKQIAPGVTRVAILRDANQAFAMSMFATIQAVAPARGVEAIPVNMRDASEIEQSVESFARSPNGGLIPVSSSTAVRYRDLIITLAARHKLPAI
jgi:putative tryptophan/tyrosine transport system substrate-binding protein